MLSSSGACLPRISSNACFLPLLPRVNTLWINVALLGIGLLLVALPAWAQPRGVEEGEVIEAAPAVAPISIGRPPSRKTVKW